MIGLIDVLQQHINSVDQAIIAIDGPAGSGKSSLSLLLQERFSATIFRMDDYFLPESKKTTSRLNEIGGNVDYERFKKDVLQHLKDRVTYQAFDCTTQSLKEEITVDKLDVVIVEGSYSMHKELFDYYTFTILLTVSKEEQLKRLKARTNESLYQRFIDEFIPLENKYFAARKLEEQVDTIFKFNIKTIKNMI